MAGEEACKYYKGPFITSIKKIDGLEEKTFMKVTGNDATRDIPSMRHELEGNHVKTYESDIYYTQVYMKQRGFSPCTWHLISNARPIPPSFSGHERYYIGEAIVKQSLDETIPEIHPLAVDIEVHNKGGMPIVEEEPIVLFGLRHKGSLHKKFEGTNRMVQKEDSEYNDRDIINGVEMSINFYYSPHILVTYNGNEFDWDYIGDRTEIVGANFEIALDGSRPHKTEFSTIAINGRPTIDLFGIAKFVVPKGSRKTQYHVHKELVKTGLVPKRDYYSVDRTGKDITGIDTNIIGKYWDTKEGRKKVIKHCTSDVIVTMDIFEYGWPFIVELSRLTNLPPDEVLSVPFTILIESFMMKMAHKLNVIIPQAEYREVPKTSGAVCFEPEKGVKENTAVFDFASMYPTILVEKNISYETYVRDGKQKDVYTVESDEGWKYRFLKSPEGLFSYSMSFLLERIKQLKVIYKDRKYKQKYAGEVQAVKTLARAIYGYFKAKKSRWHLPEGQDAIAAEGRNEIRKAAAASEKYGYPIIYGDTDSIFLEGFKEEDCEDFAKVLTEEVGAEVGFDKFYESIFFTEAKKVYAGLKPDGEIDYVGFVKSDWSQIANRVQIKILEIILKERNPEKAKDYVRWIARGIREGVFKFMDFVIWKRIRKDLDEYTSREAHIEVARRNPEAFIEEDGTVGFVVVKGPGKLYQKARHYSEVTVEDLDTRYYINNQLLAVAERILRYFFGDIDMINVYFEF